MPDNSKNPTLRVKWADLQRADKHTRWRSKCPVCPDGILPMVRSVETLKLQRFDQCLFCGQHVVYTDIRQLQRTESGMDGKRC